VLGVGSNWARFGLVSGSQNAPKFLGKQAQIGQVEIGGVGQPSVEQDGGPGTARVHWDEQVYQNELMTGFISGNTQPLSKLTVRSLQDLGYQVDITKADDFLIPGATKAPAGNGGGGATAAPTNPTKTPTKAPTKFPTKAPTNAVTKSPVTKSPTNNGGNGFNIQLVNTGPALSASQQKAFDDAVARWTEVITGDIGNTVTLQAGTNICGQNTPQNIQIDINRDIWLSDLNSKSQPNNYFNRYLSPE